MITNENVNSCPLCSAEPRELLHDDLKDVTFGAVAGKWALWRCCACGVTYLDPRPNRATISTAYQNYYTHSPAGDAPTSWHARWKARLLNGYLYWRHGVKRVPCSPTWGALVFLALPIKHIFQAHERHLPNGSGNGRTLLDVGCGDGGFVALARDLGWDASGVEPDPMAVAEGLHKGIKVRQGGIEQYDGQSSCFDVITLNHVIEHVHDPVATLRDCHRLLKPGGALWISTPNMQSLGHARFGHYWRGLETPRHLVLFTETSLAQALRKAGFDHAERLNSGLSILRFMTQDSYSISRGNLPEAGLPRVPLHLWLNVLSKEGIQHYLRPAYREFLFMMARKDDQASIQGNQHVPTLSHEG